MYPIKNTCTKHLFTESLKKALSAFSLFILTITLLAACKEDDELIKTNTTETSIKQTIDAIGSYEQFKTAERLRLKVSGVFIEPHQDGLEIEDLDNISAIFTYTLKTLLNKRQLNLEWNQKFIYPFEYEGTSKIIVSDKNGSIEGAHGLGSKYFGFDAATALYSSRLEAIVKTQLMANPIELLKLLNETKELETKTENNSFEISLGQELPSLQLEIDSKTYLPVTVRTTEVDFLMGDQTLEITFLGWTDFEGLKYPKELVYKLGGNTLRRETIEEVEFNAEINDTEFNVETTSGYDVEQGKYGYLSSQWYHRMFSFGFSQDFPLYETAITQVQENVYTITGNASLAYVSLAIETDNGVYVVEPSLNYRRSNAIIDAVKAYFKGKKIVGIITTHHHMDHFGGIRTFAQEVNNIYVGASAKDFVDEVLNSTHDLLPDGFTGNASSVTVNTISEKTVIENEAIHLLPLNTKHTEDMLLVHLPHIKGIYVGDILNAGLIYGYESYTTSAQTTLKERAQLLLNYINNNNLDIETVITVHGGTTNLEEVKNLAAK